MESGDVASGLGHVQWWGFSPSMDFSQYKTKENELNILLVGSSDIRHILHTVSKLKVERVNFWIYESDCVVIARQMLLLLIIAEPAAAYGLNIKTSLYLDIFGNALLRASTAKYLKQKSRVLSEMITDLEYGKRRAKFINLEKLKFKDRDRLDEQFEFWRRETEPFHIRDQWDIRLRRYLGARYDAMTGAFDWDLSMQLYERKATMITKTEYYRFRTHGIAFSPFEEENHQTPNKSLSSSKVMKDKSGDKNAYRGYWGDIAVGGFICHGIETENQDLLKTINKKPSNSSEHIAQWNISKYIQDLHDSFKQNEEVETALVKRREVYSSCYMDNTEVTFLSPSSFEVLADSRDYFHKFDMVFLSVANASKLKQSDLIQNCLKPEGFVFVESPKYIIDLKGDQAEETIKTIKQLAKDSNLEHVMDNSLNAILTFQKMAD